MLRNRYDDKDPGLSIGDDNSDEPRLDAAQAAAFGATAADLTRGNQRRHLNQPTDQAVAR